MRNENPSCVPEHQPAPNEDAANTAARVATANSVELNTHSAGPNHTAFFQGGVDPGYDDTHFTKFFGIQPEEDVVGPKYF